MWSQVRSILALIASSIFVLIASGAESTVVQEPDGRAPDAAVEKQKGNIEATDRKDLSTVLRESEQELRRIQNQALKDHAFKNLAEGPIQRRVDKARFTLVVNAPTDDQIMVPTKGNAASIKVSGNVGIRIEYTANKPQEIIESGLCDGVVIWKTNNPNIFVTISWISNDSSVPDRLLAIIRDELDRDGLRRIPMHKLDWPFATTAERLSQLIPPDAQPVAAPEPRSVRASPQMAREVFEFPQDVAAAYLQARAKQDLRAYLLCLTPASQGAMFRALLFAMQELPSGMAKTARTIEERLKLKLFDDKNQLRESKELDELFAPPGKPLDKFDETTDAWLYESVRTRVGDVPAFLADCMPEFPEPATGDDLPKKCEGIRVEGDKASGYLIQRRPSLTSEEVEQNRVNRYSPRCVPIRFRRIGGSWLIAFPLLDD